MISNESGRQTVDRKYHDTIAAEYDETVVAPRAFVNELIFSELIGGGPVAENTRVLDLGCGTGHMLLRWAQRYPEVTGVDHSAGMLDVARRAVARRGFANVSLIEAPVEDFLRSATHTYAAISAVGFLHHLQADERASLFSHARRLLAPGGMLIVAEPMDVPPDVPGDIEEWNRQSPLVRTGYSMPVVDPDEAPLDEAEFRAAIREAGLACAAEIRSWEIFNHSHSPGWLERFHLRRLFRRHRGKGNVLAMKLTAAR